MSSDVEGGGGRHAGRGCQASQLSEEQQVGGLHVGALVAPAQRLPAHGTLAAARGLEAGAGAPPAVALDIRQVAGQPQHLQQACMRLDVRLACTTDKAGLH